jgi:hypothetical protein
MLVDPLQSASSLPVLEQERFARAVEARWREAVEAREQEAVELVVDALKPVLLAHTAAADTAAEEPCSFAERKAMAEERRLEVSMKVADKMGVNKMEVGEVRKTEVRKTEVRKTEVRKTEVEDRGKDFAAAFRLLSVRVDQRGPPKRYSGIWIF